MYEDMVGFARLKRMKIIVEAMAIVSKRRWEVFLDSLRLDKILEFNKGDVGFTGRIQVTEPADVSDHC